MSNTKQRSEETIAVRITVTAMRALKTIQEREMGSVGIAPSYSEILSRLAVKEAAGGKK